MEAPGTRSRSMESDARSPLIYALSVLGGALFLLGVLRLISDFTASVIPDFGCFLGGRFDPTPALMCFKLAGWFVTAGWLLQYLPSALHRVTVGVRKPVQLQRFHTLLTLHGDGILEMLLAGLFFIVVLVLGMVSLWAGTIQQ